MSSMFARFTRLFTVRTDPPTVRPAGAGAGRALAASAFFVVAALGASLAVPAHAGPVTRIGYMPITDHLALGIAIRKMPLTLQSLEPVKFTDWATLSEGLRSGSIEGAFLLAPLAFQVKRSGAPVHLVLLGHRDGSALIVGTHTGAHSAADLKGKTLAIPQRYSTHNFLLHRYASANGLLYPADFSLVELTPTEMVASISQRQIDGFIVAEPIPARAELLGVGSVLVLSKDIWEHHPDCVLVLRDEFLKNRNAAQELVSALVEAAEYIESNRAEAADLGAPFLGQPADAVRRALLEPVSRVTFRNLTPRPGELREIYSYMQEKMGLFPGSIEMEAFVSDDLAKEAYRRRQTQ